MSERPAWREEARAMSDAVPYARSQRIRRRLRQRAQASTTRQRRHWSAMAAFVAGAALVLLSVLVLRPSQVHVAEAWRPSPPVIAAAPSPDPALRALGCGGGAEALADGRSAALVGPCRVSAPGLKIVVARAATLAGTADAITLDAGEAQFDVDPGHPRTAPFSVTTPAGRVEVTGTRFTVRHDADGGALTLHEGHVRMVTADRVQHVTAGQQVTWSAQGPSYRIDTPSSPTHQAPSAQAPAPRSAKPRAPAQTPGPSSRALVEEMERLRAAGAHTRAMTILETALPTLPRREREVLSFELGKLIERSRGSKAACSHWDAYAGAFPRGRYADLVDEERARLSCDQP